MDDLRMGEVIEEIRGEIRPRHQKVFEWLRSIASRAAWRLWGRRRSIRRMQFLAFVPPQFSAVRDPEKEAKRIAEHREKLNSIHVEV